MAWTNPKTWATMDPLNASNLNTYIRDNQQALKSRLDTHDGTLSNLAANLAHRVRTVTGSSISLATNADVFGAPTLDLTIQKTNANVMAGCQVTFQEPSTGRVSFEPIELRLRCYQQSPAKTVDVLVDYVVKDGGIISLAPTTVFIGFAAGTVSFSVVLTAGGPVNLMIGSHTIWAMEL